MGAPVHYPARPALFNTWNKNAETARKQCLYRMVDGVTPRHSSVFLSGFANFHDHRRQLLAGH
jgi:hypothetical protein